MKTINHLPKVIFSDRLILYPYTIEICEEVLNDRFDIIENIGLKKGVNWPDLDVIETLPKIITNLSKVHNPTGFESWMIIKKETNEIIGDIGFKGFDYLNNSCDIGYGIIEAERKKGYADEAARNLINWVRNLNASTKITASTLFNNSSSIKLLQKLNFVELKRDHTFIYWVLE